MNCSFADLQPDTVEAFGVQVNGNCYPLNSKKTEFFKLALKEPALLLPGSIGRGVGVESRFKRSMTLLLSC